MESKQHKRYQVTGYILDLMGEALLTKRVAATRNARPKCGGLPLASSADLGKTLVTRF